MSHSIGSNATIPCPKLAFLKGCLVAQSPEIDAACQNLLAQSKECLNIPTSHRQNQKDRDENATATSLYHYHVTILTAQERKATPSETLQDFHTTLPGKPMVIFGIGQVKKEAYFAVVAFPHAATLRRKYINSPRKEYFHITLAFGRAGDMHDVCKGPKTLCFHKLIDLREMACVLLPLAKSNLRLHHSQLAVSMMDVRSIANLCRDLSNNLAQRHEQNETSLVNKTSSADDETNDQIDSLRLSFGLVECRAAGLEEDYQRVLAVADRILASHPNNPVALAMKGFAHAKRNNLGEAVLSLEQSLQYFRLRQLNFQDKHRLLLQRAENVMVECCRSFGREVPLPPLVKFPRTTHIFRPAGSKSVTDDDIVDENGDFLRLLQAGKTSVFVQEKVDGSNLGISLSYDGKEILVQNRSHYLHSGEHPQYGPLASWLLQHKEALKEILSATTAGSSLLRSSRHGYILYGEWMVARHSIPYHNLPGYFVAFDLFDIEHQQFISLKRLHDTLRLSRIPVAPTIAELNFDGHVTTSNSEA
jgi:RNA ligase